MKQIDNEEKLKEETINSTINDTESKFLKNECQDIGKVWKKNCPKCGFDMLYVNKKAFNHSILKNILCNGCNKTDKTVIDINRKIYETECFTCKKITKHKTFNKNKKIICKYCIANAKKIYKRNCPKCNKEIFYKNKWYYNTCLKLNRICKCCASPAERNYLFGKKMPEELKEKVRATYKLKKPQDYYWYGKKLSEETKKKISENKKQNPIKLTTDQRKKISIRMKGNTFRKGIPHTEKTKALLRAIQVNKIRQFKNIISPNFNEISCYYFEWLNKWNGWNGVYAKNKGEFYVKELGYWLDYYEPTHNIVIEWDEKSHFDCEGCLKEKDIIRMNRIKSHLNCKFYRYNEKLNEIKEW